MHMCVFVNVCCVHGCVIKCVCVVIVCVHTTGEQWCVAITWNTSHQHETLHKHTMWRCLNIVPRVYNSDCCTIVVVNVFSLLVCQLFRIGQQTMMWKGDTYCVTVCEQTHTFTLSVLQHVLLHASIMCVHAIIGIDWCCCCVCCADVFVCCDVV